MCIEKWSTAGGQPSVGEVNQNDIELCADGIEPTERSVHGIRQALMGKPIARQFVEIIGPPDVCLGWCGFQGDPIQLLETGIWRYVF
jgi:hypothetical protein